MGWESEESNGFLFDFFTVKHLAYSSILPKILAAASHEMIQPLNIIKISAGGIISQVKKEKNFPPAVLIDELDLIKGQADRLAGIISQVRALSSDETEPEHIAADLNSIAEQSFSLCRRQLETHGIETSLELQSELQQQVPWV